MKKYFLLINYPINESIELHKDRIYYTNTNGKRQEIDYQELFRILRIYYQTPNNNE